MVLSNFLMLMVSVASWVVRQLIMNGIRIRSWRDCFMGCGVGGGWWVVGVVGGVAGKPLGTLLAIDQGKCVLNHTKGNVHGACFVTCHCPN